MYEQIIALLNGLLPKPLTKTELEVLVVLLHLRSQVDPDEWWGRQHRELACEELGFPSLQHINNHIMYLRRKQVLIGKGDQTKLHPALNIEDYYDGHQFIFTFVVQTDNDEVSPQGPGGRTVQEAAAPDGGSDTPSAEPLLRFPAPAPSEELYGFDSASRPRNPVRPSEGYTSPYLAPDWQNQEGEPPTDV